VVVCFEPQESKRMMVSTQKSRGNVNFEDQHYQDIRDNGLEAASIELEVVLFFFTIYDSIEAETECLRHHEIKLQLGV
jgi:hypothetical protein